MRRKRTTAALLALLTLAAVALSGCGGSGDNTPAPAKQPAASASASAPADASGSGTAAAETETEHFSDPDRAYDITGSGAQGEPYDVGEFTVTVPEGWTACPTPDFSASADSDGQRPESTREIMLLKGGSSRDDYGQVPSITINYKDDRDAKGSADFWRGGYDSYTDLNVSINGTRCEAFEGRVGMASKDVHWTHNQIYLPLGDSSYFSFEVMVESTNFEGLSLDDADVQLILSSAALK